MRNHSFFLFLIEILSPIVVRISDRILIGKKALSSHRTERHGQPALGCLSSSWSKSNSRRSQKVSVKNKLNSLTFSIPTCLQFKLWTTKLGVRTTCLFFEVFDSPLMRFSNVRKLFQPLNTESTFKTPVHVQKSRVFGEIWINEVVMFVKVPD